MRWLIVLTAVLASAAASQARISEVEPAQPLQLAPPDALEPDLQGLRGSFECSVTAAKPELGFDFRFHTGYQVTIPLKELARPDNRLTIILGVRAYGNKEKAIHLVQRFRVPEIEHDSPGYVVLQGNFLLGEGHYHVEWLVRDADGRVCPRYWDLDAVVHGKDGILAARLPKDLIQAVEPTPFHEEVQVTGRPIDPVLRVKVIINFAPQSQKAALLDHNDLEVLAMILRSIGSDPHIGSVSIVACSLPERQVLYRSQNAPAMDLPALGEALKQLKPGQVDVKQLAAKNGAAEFLTQLMAEEMRDESYDALIFVGPKYRLDVNIGRGNSERFGGGDRPMFYLNYSLDPASNPWRDAIGSLVRRSHGFEYTITEPRDLFTAWSDVVSRILRSKVVPMEIARQ
jgi:hypothetical protein